MKKNYILLTLLCLLFSSFKIYSKEIVKKSDVSYDLGGRLTVDMGYLGSQKTEMNSGVAITDLRVNSSFFYDNWKFYAELGIKDKEVRLKNIYGSYSFTNTNNLKNITIGYTKEPLGMSRNTNIFNYHFIERPNSVYALTNNRNLGINYKYVNDMFFLSQGIYSENLYNDQESGSQGADVSGRWVYKPINYDKNVFHLGGSLCYKEIKTGVEENGETKTSLELKPVFNTRIDTQHDFLYAEIPWASNVFDCSVEALYMLEKVFIRGEYMKKEVKKSTPLDNIEYQDVLKTSRFDGGYLETGYVLFGGDYSYDSKKSLLNGHRVKNTLEVVGRFNYTNLNDPFSSVQGGKLNSFTLGFNYVKNSHVKFFMNYTYNHLNNNNYPEDNVFNFFQGRGIIAF